MGEDKKEDKEKTKKRKLPKESPLETVEIRGAAPKR